METLLCLALAGSARAVEPARYPYAKALEPPAAAVRTIGRFELDEDLFDGTDNAFANLRIVNGTDEETPFLVRPVPQRRKVVSEHDIASKIIDFELRPDNRFRVTVERASMTSPPPAVSLVLHSGRKNYEKLVTVQSSADRDAWVTLVEDVPIYDYSKYLDLRRERVWIAADSGRYYRIEVSNIMEEQLSPLVQIARETQDGKLVSRIENISLRREDFRIERVQLVERRETWTDSGAKRRAYTVAGFAATQDLENKTTVVEFRTRHVPLREMTFEVSNVYFSRGVVVEAHPRAEGSAGWVRLAGGTLQRVPGSDPVKGRVVTLPRTSRYRRYRATIRNMDSPPLEVTGVTVTGEVAEAVFLCQAGGTYRAVYGAADARAPRYDIDRVVQGVTRDAMDVYTPGAEEPNAPFRKPRLAWLRSGKVLLVPAVILMVFVLVWLIAKSAKHMDFPE